MILFGIIDIKALAMIFGPNLGYLVQYREIYTSNNAEGFSNLVWFVLLVAFITRVFWWMCSSTVSNTVLSSSLLMIICQLLLLELTVRLKKKNSKKQAGQKKIKQNDIVWYFSNFWSWNDFNYYIRFISIYACTCLIGTYFYKDNETYALFLGNVSSFFEAMLAVPQLIRNFMRKSTKGVTIVLILGWVLGDVFKMYYYYSESAPIQLVACSIFQILTDVTILLQFFIFGDKGSLFSSRTKYK